MSAPDTDAAAPVPPRRRPSWLEDAERVDVAVYAAIAGTPTPSLDRAMSRLARAADYSRLSLASWGARADAAPQRWDWHRSA